MMRDLWDHTSLARSCSGSCTTPWSCCCRCCSWTCNSITMRRNYGIPLFGFETSSYTGLIWVDWETKHLTYRCWKDFGEPPKKRGFPRKLQVLWRCGKLAWTNSALHVHVHIIMWLTCFPPPRRAAPPSLITCQLLFSDCLHGVITCCAQLQR